MDWSNLTEDAIERLKAALAAGMGEPPGHVEVRTVLCWASAVLRDYEAGRAQPVGRIFGARELADVLLGDAVLSVDPGGRVTVRPAEAVEAA